jgi:predicted secreted protein
MQTKLDTNHLTATGAHTGTSSAAKKKPNLTINSEDMFGKHAITRNVRIVKGQNLVIDVPESGSTGYHTDLIGVDRTIGYPKETHLGAHTRRIGAPGREELVWKTNNPINDVTGKHKITLAYKAPSGQTACKITINLQIDAAAPR